jgi:hypothetical protein
MAQYQVADDTPTEEPAEETDFISAVLAYLIVLAEDDEDAS